MILKFLSGPLGMYALAGVAVILIASLTYGYAQHQLSLRYKTQRDAIKAENMRLIESVNSKNGVIDELTGSLEEWQDKATASVKASTEAAQRAEDYETRLSAFRRRIRALTEADHESPTCKALLDTDIAPICMGVADGVRQWANHDLQRSGGEGPDTSDSTNRP